MDELTLESLARRVEALERMLKANPPAPPAPPAKDWRRSVGMFAGNEFMRQVDAEGAAIREADREAARKEPGE